MRFKKTNMFFTYSFDRWSNKFVLYMYILLYTIYIFECFIYLCNYELDQFQYEH